MHRDIWKPAQEKVTAEPSGDRAYYLGQLYRGARQTDRFLDSVHLVSYIGLAVPTYNSREREPHRHITKRA